MMSTTALRRMIVCAAPLAIAGLVLAPPVSAQGREGSFEKTLTVSGAVDLDVQSGSGQIRIQPGAAGTVRVSARLRASGWPAGSGDVDKRIRQIEQNPPIEQNGNAIRIGRFADSDLARDISISYDVTVPADTKLAARSGSGAVVVGDVKGPVAAESGSGSVTVGRVGGAVTVSSGSGSLKVDGAASLEARTGSGAITATGVAGPTKASSGSGSISVAQTGKGDVTASAGSGSITLTGASGAARVNTGSGSIGIEGRPAAPWSLHTASGSVTVTVPPDAAFDLDARTNSGTIDSVHPVTMTVTGPVDKRRVQGKVRGGGPLVEIDCSSGSIRIR